MGKDWRNRITEVGEESPSNLLANPRNFRRHPKHQQAALEGVLDEVGWVQDVIVNKRTGYLIDGHLRVELAMRHGVESVPVKYVDLSDDEEKIVLSTFDPISALATRDREVLADLLREVTTDNESVRAMVDDLASKNHIDLEGSGDDLAQRYTTKIQTPIYEPTGENPSVSSLTNVSRYEELLTAIDSSSVDDEAKKFLRLAAARHVQFDYGKIAEYYAHADPQLQELMEDSALVIIDFDKAIELGFVQMTSDMLDLMEEEDVTGYVDR